MIVIILYLMLLLNAVSANAHGMYTNTSDPVFNYEGCCGDRDCATIPASWVYETADGVRIIMTLEQSRQVNANSTAPIDALVPEKRIQPSPDMEYHVCIYQVDRTKPRSGVICFWGFRGV